MGAVRTQVYLTEEQRRRIDALAAAEEVTMAEIVRRALDAYLAEETPDPERALSVTFGAAPQASVARPGRMAAWLRSWSTPTSSSTTCKASEPWRREIIECATR